MSATAATDSSAAKPARKFPTPCWAQDEALVLIQAYRDRWYALRRGYLRTADWDAVAEDIGRMYPGAVPPKTSAQCRHKIEKLRQRYRAEKQRALSFPAGQFQSAWFFFEAMHSMEKNGNGSNPDEETQSGNDLVCMKIVNSNSNHQLKNASIDSGYGGLTPGRGIRFKPVAADSNLITIASKPNNFRASHNHDVQEEDNDDEFEDLCYTEAPIGKNLGKSHRLSSQNHATRFQFDHHSNNAVNYQNLGHSGARPRKISKTSSHSKQSYWNENEDHDNNLEEDDVWVKMPKDRRNDDDLIGEIVSSIRLLADGFVKMEKMKMDVVYEIEKRRMEAEVKRDQLILESQKQIIEAFIKGLSDN